MKKIVDHGFIFCLKLLLIMKKHLFDVISFLKVNRAISIYKLYRTEYKKLAHF